MRTATSIVRSTGFTATVYTGLLRNRNIATFLGWDTRTSQVTPPPSPPLPSPYSPRVFREIALTVCLCPCNVLRGERHYESWKVSCPRIQHNNPARARAEISQFGVECASHQAIAASTRCRLEPPQKII